MGGCYADHPAALAQLRQTQPRRRRGSRRNRLVSAPILQYTGRAMTTYRRLDLRSLLAGMPGLSEAAGQYLAEAAAVCLEERDHQSEATLFLDGDHEEDLALAWAGPVTDQARRTHADPEDATENGACGVAAVLMHTLTDLAVVNRSRKGSGFDYWLGSDDGEPFVGQMRMEVSGIRKGEPADIKARVRQKIRQTKRSDGLQLPAVVVVVEFGSPRSRAVTRCL